MPTHLSGATLGLPVLTGWLSCWASRIALSRGPGAPVGLAKIGVVSARLAHALAAAPVKAVDSAMATQTRYIDCPLGPLLAYDNTGDQVHNAVYSCRTGVVECAAAVSVYFDYAAVEQARQEIAAELAGEAAQRARELGVPLSFVREPGDAAHVLTSVARSAGADLVVVGKSAKMRHHLAGSLGRRLVCHHDAPVVVVVP